MILEHPKWSINEELKQKTETPQAYRELAIAIFNLAEVYNITKNDKAKELFERVVELGKDTGDKYLKGLVRKTQEILDNNF